MQFYVLKPECTLLLVPVLGRGSLTPSCLAIQTRIHSPDPFCELLAWLPLLHRVRAW